MVKTAKNCMVAVFWLIIWQIAALLVNNKILLAGPLETVSALKNLAESRDFWDSIITSYGHIMLGILIGAVIGASLSILAYIFPVVGMFLSPLVTTIKSIPVASFIILILIWIGSDNVSVFISGLVVFPILYVGMENGLKSADEKLLEMAHVYRMPRWNSFKYIYFPALIPFLVSACALAIPMGFKSGVAAEVIGQPLLSMGNGLYRAKIYLDTGELFAWTLVIILISWATEKVVLLLLSLFNRKGEKK